VPMMPRLTIHQRSQTVKPFEAARHEPSGVLRKFTNR
jgi:hypothetical protein